MGRWADGVGFGRILVLKGWGGGNNMQLGWEGERRGDEREEEEEEGARGMGG